VGELTQGHARALLPVGEPDEQHTLAEKIAKEGWSVRRTETEVQTHLGKLDNEYLRVVGEDGVSRPTTPAKNEQLAHLERELEEALGTKVSLSRNAKGKGRITIHFAGHEEYERLHASLVGAGHQSPQATDAAPPHDAPLYGAEAS